MFLIANLQMKMLASAVSKTNVYEILEIMPEKLDECYKAA